MLGQEITQQIPLFTKLNIIFTVAGMCNIPYMYMCTNMRIYVLYTYKYMHVHIYI